jgi:tripartite-type tricarboxylate transporter receptor subunit TctC
MGLAGAFFLRLVGLFAPKATPKEIIGRLDGAAVQALADPAPRSRLADLDLRFSRLNDKRRGRWAHL